MIGGIKKIGEFVRKETVLTVALLLAVISAFIVPPDSAYVDYIDFRTLAILFCLMTVVAGFSQQGMFGIIAKSMINRMGSLRAVTIVLIFMCFFFSMFITNDVSLITFVPMTLTVLGMAGEEVLTRWMVPVITLHSCEPWQYADTHRQSAEPVSVRTCRDQRRQVCIAHAAIYSGIGSASCDMCHSMHERKKQAA